MWQTAGNQNLIPAVLDSSLSGGTQKWEIKIIFLPKWQGLFHQIL